MRPHGSSFPRRLAALIGLGALAVTAGHPLGADGKVRTDLGRQSHTYLIDASFGQTKNKNDVQVGYAFLRQEQDAVLDTYRQALGLA